MSDSAIPRQNRLTGALLLAAPRLRDPHFSRAVIFLAAHNKSDGAFGYILNRPLEKRVTDLLPDQELGELGQIPVFLGGPVATDKLAFAALCWNGEPKELKCVTHLSVQDALKQIQAGNDVRGFVGYSGWMSGQIEAELERSSWIVTPPCETVLTSDEPRHLWRDLLKEMGPIYRLMATMPDDVSGN